MTSKEASIIIGNIPINGDECYSIAEYQEAKAMGIKALEQQTALQNRCYALTHGVVCSFCNCECENRTLGKKK